MSSWRPSNKPQGILSKVQAHTQAAEGSQAAQQAIAPVAPPASPAPEVAENDPERVLTMISELASLIEQSTDIGESVALRDRAQALQYLSRKVDLEMDIKNRATIAVINAKRKIGELTMGLPQATPFSHSENKGKTDLLEQYGLDHNEVYRNETLAKLDKKRLGMFIDKKLADGYEITVGAAMKYAQNVIKPKPRRTPVQPSVPQAVESDDDVPTDRSVIFEVPDSLTWENSEYYDYLRFELLPDDVKQGDVWEIVVRKLK